MPACVNQAGGWSRRNVLRAGLVGVGAATVSLASEQASAAPQRVPSAVAGAVDTRIVDYTAGTSGSVISSPAGDRLIVEIQGVLWSLPRKGGTATALTAPELEPARMAWSPDGSLVAVCSYRDGGFHLWTMASDGSGLRQLTSGPWDDRGVTWSPDGTRIAFSSERGGDPAVGSSYKIWTIDVRSGELTQLTGEAGVEDYDPAWHPRDDRILFVRARGQIARTLASVPAHGGKVTVERTVDTGTLVGPSVSADGRVAYVQIADATLIPAAASDLVVDGKPVTDGEDVAPFPPCWTAAGELLYLSDGQIRVRRPGNASAETIPFTASLSLPRPRYAKKPHDFDSTAARPVRGIHLPVLSPDGQSVAFAALNALWVQPIGGRPRKLVQANPAGYVQMPSWAPDGRSVLYSYEEQATGHGLIAVHRYWLDSGTDQVVATGGRLNPVLSPDATRLACHDSTGNLIVRDLATGTEKTLATPLGANGLPGRPSWSPDGKYLAFCDRNRLNQRFREGYNIIRVVDAASGKSSSYQPTPHASLSDRGNGGPVWSPDGSSMAFVMESALWVMPVGRNGAPSGPPRRITDEAADHPSWSGDSRTLLYESSGQLRLINADGSRQRTISVPLEQRRHVPPRSDLTRVHAGRLWDGTNDEVRENVDIVIAGNRIVAVEPHRTGLPGEKLIDASRSTIIPGLWDSHSHPWQYTYGGRQTSLMLAYGITANASLGGFAHEAVRIKESVDAGTMAGPRLFFTGELIDGSRVAYSMGRAHSTEDGVRRSLHRAIALDYDVVKTYVRAPGWVMQEATRTAHEHLGVLSGSHLLSPGANVGQDLTTHLQATNRTEYGRAFSVTGHTYSDVYATYRGGDFQIIITPFFALSLVGADPALAKDPRVTTLMPPWDSALVTQLAASPPTANDILAVDKETAVYHRIVADGGVLAMGTDAPLTPIGLHLHLGLRALHRHGGLSVPQTLRSATVVPARLFGVDDDLGTIQPGKLADLVAIDGNPFDNFDDLIRTSWTMRDGLVYRQEDLVAAFTTGRSQLATAHHIEWLHVSRQMRREPCCSDHAFQV